MAAHYTGLPIGDRSLLSRYAKLPKANPRRTPNRRAACGECGESFPREAAPVYTASHCDRFRPAISAAPSAARPLFNWFLHGNSTIGVCSIRPKFPALHEAAIKKHSITLSGEREAMRLKRQTQFEGQMFAPPSVVWRRCAHSGKRSYGNCFLRMLAGLYRHRQRPVDTRRGLAFPPAPAGPKY